MKEITDKRYLLGVLLLTLAFSSMDRLTLGLVLQDVKSDLRLSDTQLGLLSGIAFAVFYSVMGIPIARWADRGNRVFIIAISTALWSVMVALCATTTTFMQLLLVRVGVAVGEAGCIPPAHSLIADYFTRAERPRAVAVYLLGGPLSALIGYFLAGWLNEFYGWRATLVCLGAPGFGLAWLVALSLQEPRRSKPISNAVERPSDARPTIKQIHASLWGSLTFRHLLIAFAVVYFFGSGLSKWQAAFFVRSYGLKTGELGMWFALIFGLGGLLGTYWGGELASRYAAYNERLQLKAIAAIYCAFGAFHALAYLSPSRYASFGLLALGITGGTMAFGPLFATLQMLVPERMRATAIAVIFLFANLIGAGLGPLAAGFLSDTLRPLAGEESLRYALLLLCPGYCWAAWHLWRASRTVTHDLEVALVERDRAAPGVGRALTASTCARS